MIPNRMLDVTVTALHQPLIGGSGDVGVLLCHGFTGSPFALRPWADDLLDGGYRVRLPRLPGHGTTWHELAHTSWLDWYECVEREYTQLATECQQVVVAGISMGGALALRLAQMHQTVAGLVLVNPAVASHNRMVRFAKYLRLVLPTIGSIESDIAKPGVSELGYERTPLSGVATMNDLWRVVRRDLGQVNAPLLVFRSAVDHVVPARSTRFILDNVSSQIAVERFLPNSYHVATLDWDAPGIFSESRDFIAGVTKAKDGSQHPA